MLKFRGKMGVDGFLLPPLLDASLLLPPRKTTIPVSLSAFLAKNSKMTISQAESFDSFDKGNKLCQMGSVTSVLPKVALAGFPPEDILSLVVDSEAVIPKSKSTHTLKKIFVMN